MLIVGGERHVKGEIQGVAIPGLAIAQACILLCVTVQKLDLKYSSVNFKYVNSRLRCVGREKYFSGLSLFVRLVEVCDDDLDFSL